LASFLTEFFLIKDFCLTACSFSTWCYPTALGLQLFLITSQLLLLLGVLCIWQAIFLFLLSRFSCSLCLHQFTVMYLGAVFFAFILLERYWAFSYRN
jgi:hypothetical protein